MAPLIMLAAQLYSKHKQQEDAKRQALIEIQKRKAQALGGNTYGIDAAQFNRDLSQHSYASPEELMNIYGSLKGGDDGGSQYDSLRAGKPGVGPMGEDSYGAPSSGDVAARSKARQSGLMDPWADDPYGLNVRV